MQRADVLAIQVDSDVVIECQDGECFFGSSLALHGDGTEIAGRAARFKALADVIVGDNWRLFLEELV